RNRQNDRWICREASEVPMVFRTKNPAAVMVLGVISTQAKGQPGGVLEVLRNVVKPWIDTVPLGGSTLSAGLCPAHKAKTVQAWSRETPGPPSQISTLVTTTCREVGGGGLCDHNSVEALKRPSRLWPCPWRLRRVQVVRAFRSVWRLWWKLEEDTLNKIDHN
ncbi:Transposable element tcb2 transposase, partial [Caligus rogercresseyi]